MADLIATSKNYLDLLARLKSQIRTVQVRAAVAVNQELVLLYLGIGKEILSRQKTDGWGSKVIERLPADLHLEFPEMKGLSARNLKYMRAFAEAWPIVQQPVAQLPWGHNVRLLDFVKSAEERLWYAEQAIQNSWNRNAGRGFQARSAVLPSDLKMGAFKPEYAGKMNFYLSAIDDMLRHPDDKASIGLILCQAKKGIVAEYAVRDIGKPPGISVFEHLEKLPEQLKGTLPTIEEIEAELKLVS